MHRDRPRGRSRQGHQPLRAEHPPLTLTGGEIQLDDFGAELTGAFENVYQTVYCPFWDPYGRATAGHGRSAKPTGRVTRRPVHGPSRSGPQPPVPDGHAVPARRAGRASGEPGRPQVDALGDLTWRRRTGRHLLRTRGAARAHRWSAAAPTFCATAMRAASSSRGSTTGASARTTCCRSPNGRKPPPTRAQKKQQLDRDYRLRSHLRYLLEHDGCRARQKHHQKLGPRCRLWLMRGTS